MNLLYLLCCTIAIYIKLQEILRGGAPSLATTAAHWKWPDPPDLGISRLHWASGELTPHYLRGPNTWGDVNSLVSSLSFLRPNGRSGLFIDRWKYLHIHTPKKVVPP